MTISWPASLPSWALADSFVETLGDQATYATMDSGPMRVRRKATAVEDIIVCAFVLTMEQYRTLRSFYRSTIYGGSKLFVTRHPAIDEAITVRMRQPPELTPLGGGSGYLAKCTFHIQP